MNIFAVARLLIHHRRLGYLAVAIVGLFVINAPSTFAQMDQGTIAGVVQDTTGAVIPHASVTATNTGTGLVLHTKTDGSGIYVFPPVKIGNFTVSATSPGFQTTTQQNIHVDVQSRLNIVLVLLPGVATKTVIVTTAPPLIQTQNASVGQVMSSNTVDHTPLNGRNWVYIAQLSAGVVPGSGSGSPGTGTGDFEANGQRPEQNNFILDGVDDNSESPNLENQASWAVLPPPDALAEFKIQTADFSAEFGHSAGAVINTSVKSGTNALHGDMWEYFRNDALDAQDWDALTVPEYRENQFGATLGFPIIPNKLFFFGYSGANRIVFGNTVTTSVPTALMRQGNFSEILNPSLTSNGEANQLYVPGSAGTVKQACNGQNNVLCPDQIDAVAQKILNLYPLPNTNGGKLYNNYVESFPGVSNTWQWGTRVDWNISSKDQAFARFSYWNEPSHTPPLLGLPLDGAVSNNQQVNQVENFVLSETHIFNPTFANEFRFGYNYNNFAALQSDYNSDNSSMLGLGGIPYASGNGGLPHVAITDIAAFGSRGFLPNYTWVDEYQILDNGTKQLGNHSMRFGVDIESTRSIDEVPPAARGTYSYSGRFTSIVGKSFTGYGVADFLENQMNSATLSTLNRFHLSHGYRAGYFQDDWKVNTRLTLNLGLRYDNYQPPREAQGAEANFNLTGPISPGAGQAVLIYSTRQKGIFLAPSFLNYLSSNNVSIRYSDNPALANGQSTNLAPRVGLAYSVDKATVLRAGFGIFYGGEGSTGSPAFLENYPFQFTSTFPSASICEPGNCQTDGLYLETGFQDILSQGLTNYVSQPAFVGVQAQIKTPYSENYNLSVEKSLGGHIAATLSYVGSVNRHLRVYPDYNRPAALTDPRLNSDLVNPFPTLGSIYISSYLGAATYNSLQAKLEKRYSDGLDFLATYTWSHALDDAVDPFAGSQDSGYRDPNLIGFLNDFSNSPWDVRQRLTFNGYYQLPFGVGRSFANHAGLVNALIGGWATDLVFTAQTGFPISVTTDLGSAGPNGATANAILVGDPFAPGGSPDPSNPTITCATSTKNKAHWYNPCAFANPPLAFPEASVAGSPISTTRITGMNALPYLGGRRFSIPGPGYERVSMSLFKDIPTFHDEYLQLRADAFNVLNTPSYGAPSVANDSSNGGEITSSRSFQSNTPDARFFQLSAKYVF